MTNFAAVSPDTYSQASKSTDTLVAILGIIVQEIAVGTVQCDLFRRCHSSWCVQFSLGTGGSQLVPPDTHNKY